MATAPAGQVTVLKLMRTIHTINQLVPSSLMPMPTLLLRSP